MLHPHPRKKTHALSILDKERIQLPGVSFSTKNYSLHKSQDWKKKNLHVQKGSNHFSKDF